jgi:ParB/RepB/Spo0J family partition protein
MATSTTENASNRRASIGRVELREIPLSRIVVPEGFNPRGVVVHDAELEAMAETMRQRGCLQPVRVRASETGTGEYLLIAGERRYHAAAIAALMQLPAVVLPAGAGDEAEHLDLLTDAMIENEVRCELNPLQRALGFRAMIEHGLNVRGVAERMGGKAKRSSREKRIREHLTILTLPEDVRKLVAAGEVPMLAVKALAELAAIHEELPAYAVAAVLDTDDEYSEPYTWPEVTESALKIALSHCEVLPAGLFLSSQSYPLDTFELGEKAKKDLAAYEKLVGRAIVAMRFSFEHIEQARLLGAAHQAEYGTLIVGEDVATRLAEDYIAGVVKEARSQARRQREAEKERQAAGGSDVEGTGGDAGQPEGSGEGESTGQDAGAQREAERKKREKAIRFNLDLGVLAFKHLPKIKVDERVLRILASVDLARSLREIASRGARLSMPGWVTQTQQRNQKMKTTYMETYKAETRAGGFLAGPESGLHRRQDADADRARVACQRGRRSTAVASQLPQARFPWAVGGAGRAGPERDRPRAHQGGPASRTRRDPGEADRQGRAGSRSRAGDCQRDRAAGEREWPSLRAGGEGARPGAQRRRARLGRVRPQDARAAHADRRRARAARRRECRRA